MNQHDISIGENYNNSGSTLTRDASLFTSTAVPGELSKLMEDTFIIFQIDRDKFFFPDLDFVFHKYEFESSTTRNVEITSIPSMTYSLRRPILIIVSKEEDEIKAEIPDLELYEFASNEDDAIHELIQDLLDLCNDLFDISDDKLGKHPRNWKNYLKSIISTNAK